MDTQPESHTSEHAVRHLQSKQEERRSRALIYDSTVRFSFDEQGWMNRLLCFSGPRHSSFFLIQRCLPKIVIESHLSSCWALWEVEQGETFKRLLRLSAGADVIMHRPMSKSNKRLGAHLSMWSHLLGQCLECSVSNGSSFEDLLRPLLWSFCYFCSVFILDYSEANSTVRVASQTKIFTLKASTITYSIFCIWILRLGYLWFGGCTWTLTRLRLL